MGASSRLGRHPVLASLGGGLLLLIVSALAVGWYALGEERRTGRLLSRLLSRQLGSPVRVDRARAEPSRLTLHGVTVPLGGHGEGTVEIRELRVEGGVLPVVFPRGRALTVVAVSTSVTLAKETAPLVAPAPDALSAIRRGILRALAWPAQVTLEMTGGELRSGEATLPFDLKAEKPGDGNLIVQLDFQRSGEPAALSVRAVGTAQGEDVHVGVQAEGDPRELQAFWPSSLPPLSSLVAQLELALSASATLGVTGQLTATPAGETKPEPIATRFRARYGARAQRVELSNLSVEWGSAFRVDAIGRAEDLETSPRLTVEVTGTVDGSRLTGNGTYGVTPEALKAQLALQPFSASTLLERFGYPPLPVPVTAQSAVLSVDGDTRQRDRPRLSGAVEFETIELPWLGEPLTRAKLSFAGSLSLSGGRISPASLDRGELSLTSAAGPIGVVTAKSEPRDGEFWPWAVQARTDDLSRLARLYALPLALSGEVEVRGTFDGAGSAPRFAGSLMAHLREGALTDGSPVGISDLRVSLPLAWGGGAAAPTGRVTAESLTAFGFVLRQIASPAGLKGRTLTLPEITYAHYGGGGRGFAEVDLGETALPLRLWVEGRDVDLGALTTEYGLTVGRITGKVRYLLALQYSAARGLVAGGRVTSQPPGGEVNIDAIKKLLSTAEGDPTGFLKQTLENLSAFSYRSLSADVRASSEGGRLNLSLKGKKWLGLFPGPVRAIDLQNVPLSLLVKTFSQSGRDSP